MLDFTFTEEQSMIRNMVRDFAQKEIAPGYKDRIKAESIPQELIKKMADIGLLGLNIPEKYGGQPKDAITVGLIIEDLARYAEDAALLVFYNYGQASFVILASDEVKEEWLPAMARGEKIVIIAATEAEAGIVLTLECLAHGAEHMVDQNRLELLAGSACGLGICSSLGWTRGIVGLLCQGRIGNTEFHLPKLPCCL